MKLKRVISSFIDKTLQILKKVYNLHLQAKHCKCTHTLMKYATVVQKVLKVNQSHKNTKWMCQGDVA